MVRKKISIMGMHCAACAGNIEKSLKKVPGVKEATVSVMTNKGFVECDEKVSEEELRKAVTRAGYKAVSIE